MIRTLDETFEKHTYRDPNCGCWFWTACLDESGYGRLGTKLYKERGAHRVSYLHFRGAIPNGLQIDHLCKIKSCVNPWHLEVVTQQENIKRSSRPKDTHRNGRKTHCSKGHPFNVENTWHEKSGGSIKRHCKECNRINAIKWRSIYKARQGIKI